MSIEPVTLYMVRCDHCPPYMGDDACWQTDDGPMLFGGPEEAEDCLRTELLKKEGWTTDGTRLHCKSCSKLFPLVEADPPPEPVPFIPGQGTLGGVE